MMWAYKQYLSPLVGIFTHLAEEILLCSATSWGYYVTCTYGSHYLSKIQKSLCIPKHTWPQGF